MGFFRRFFSICLPPEQEVVDDVWVELPEKLNLIREQMAYYFSPANMEDDAFMRTAIAEDPERYVPAETFLKFRRIQSLEATVDEILEACAACPDLQVDMENKKIRTLVPFVSDPRRAYRTINVKGLDRDETLESLREYFNACFGKVLRIGMRRITIEGEQVFAGTADIELQTEEEAYAAVENGLLYKERLLKPILVSTLKGNKSNSQNSKRGPK